MLAEERLAAGEADDEGEHDGEEETLQILAPHDRADRVEPRDHHDARTHHQDGGEDAVEDRRLMQLAINA